MEDLLWSESDRPEPAVACGWNEGTGAAGRGQARCLTSVDEQGHVVGVLAGGSDTQATRDLRRANPMVTSSSAASRCP